MNSRLQQFLDLENLTPARLADMLGVQRSGLSHILSGRNKPGYEFINKLLVKFPAISADWLLTGKGKPYKEMNNFEGAQKTPETPLSLNQPFQNKPQPNQQYNNQQLINQQYNTKQLINQQQFGQQYNNPLSDQPILDKNDILEDSQNNFSDDTLFSSVNIKKAAEEKHSIAHDNQLNTSINTISQLNENQINISKQELVRKKKSVKRVIIYYSDGSFEELFPQNL
ncbi:MAG: helix-turn-helix transcriptional regulator [Bacteroidales bacterium]